MILDLPAAYVGYKVAATSASQSSAPGLPGVLRLFVEGRAQVALEREWRITMALALRQLPPGVCVDVRDASGREWFIGPADAAAACSRQEAA